VLTGIMAVPSHLNTIFSAKGEAPILFSRVDLVFGGDNRAGMSIESSDDIYQFNVGPMSSSCQAEVLAVW
jgi:hypothetical protein